METLCLAPLQIFFVPSNLDLVLNAGMIRAM